MGMLSGNEIERCVRSGEIEITPFVPEQVNPNSYDLCLGPKLLCYTPRSGFFDLKTREWEGEEPIEWDLTKDGWITMYPGEFILGHTVEQTFTPNHVPMVEGKSSIGRMGLSVHVTAGVGDSFFNGQWTLEMTAEVPIRLYPYIPVCQVCFYTIEGEPRNYSGRYQHSMGVIPVRQ